LKKEAVDHTQWGTRCERGYSAVVMQMRNE